jgi:hypothetical protein
MGIICDYYVKICEASVWQVIKGVNVGVMLAKRGIHDW